MKKALKWISIGFGSLLLLILAAAIIVPLVVDVDKYRPQIVQAANEKLNGKLELGKLSLSLWGQIRVQVEGVALADHAGHSVLSVKDAYFHLPFASLLSGSPEMVFKMDKPELVVVKSKAGKLNVMGLMKPQTATSAAPGGGTPSTGGSATPPTQLPALVTQARLGLELRNALVNYKDEGTGLTSQVKDFNLVVRDLSLSRTTEIEVWADLDTQMGKTFAVKGPFKLTAHAKPEVANGQLDRVQVDAKVNLDDLDIASGGVFHKAKGVPFHVVMAMNASPREAQIKQMDLTFHNVEVKLTATLTNLAETTPSVSFQVASNTIELKSWNDLVPMLKEYELGGSAKLEAKGSGPSDHLSYQGKFTLAAFTAKAGKLKAQPRFDGFVDFATDQIQNMVLTMKAPGNEMTFKGKLVSFTQPHGAFELTSPGMDLDQLIDWPPPAPATTAANGAAPAAGTSTGAAQPSGAGGSTVAAVDTDASVEPLRSNPMMAGAQLTLNTQIKMLKAKGMKMTDLTGKYFLRDLVGGVEGFGMKLWQGTIKGGFAAQLKPKTPTYTMNFVADGLQLKDAVADNVQMIKNTVVGKAHFDLTGTGASFNPDPAKLNLKAKGSLKIEKATFQTIDVTKMVTEALNKSIEKVADKIPQAKGKSVNTPNGRESRYEVISSSFSIDGGKFKAPDFVAKAEANQGVDLRGDTEVGLKDYALKTTWDVIDTYNFTHAHDLSVPLPGGGDVPHVLAEGNNPVKFTVHAGCTCFQPCYSYTEVPEQLTKVALNNVTSAAGSKAKAELQKRVEQIVPKSAPPAVQNAIQNFGKKLFQ